MTKPLSNDLKVIIADATRKSAAAGEQGITPSGLFIALLEHTDGQLNSYTFHLLVEQSISPEILLKKFNCPDPTQSQHYSVIITQVYEEADGDEMQEYVCAHHLLFVLAASVTAPGQFLRQEGFRVDFAKAKMREWYEKAGIQPITHPAQGISGEKYAPNQVLQRRLQRRCQYCLRARQEGWLLGGGTQSPLHRPPQVDQHRL